MARGSRLQTEDPVEYLHERALRLLAHRARSRGELTERLLRLGFDESAVASEIARLERVGLLNDPDFAKSFTRYAVSIRGVGRRSVTYELGRKGIDAQTVDEVTAGLTDEVEEARALKLAETRGARMRGLERRVAYNRLSGFLLRRGFEGAVVRRVCARVLDAEIIDPD